MTDKNNIDIPDGYVIADINDDFRELGMSEDAIKELNDEIENEINNMDHSDLSPETLRLIDIITSDATTEEEKEAARRELDPDMYDENGNMILDDNEFFDRIEADMKAGYERMKAEGKAI